MPDFELRALCRWQNRPYSACKRLSERENSWIASEREGCCRVAKIRHVPPAVEEVIDRARTSVSTAIDQRPLLGKSKIRLLVAAMQSDARII